MFKSNKMIEYALNEADSAYLAIPNGTLFGHGDPLPSDSPKPSRAVAVENVELPPGTLCGRESIPTNRPTPPGQVAIEEMELPEGTLCVETGANGTSPSYKSFDYRTTNGNGIYHFEYLWNPSLNKFEVIILDTPSYGSRSTRAVIVHIEPSSDRRRRICVKKHVPMRKLSDAQALSVAWAEGTQLYIETGETLDAQAKRKYSPKSFLAKFKKSFKETFDYTFSTN